MTPPDLHADLEDLARQLPDPPPTSLATVAARVRQRGRRRTAGLVAAALLIVVAGAGVLASQWWPRPVDPVAPEVVEGIGPRFAEVHTCPAEVPDCPDLPVDEALDRVVAFLEERPAVTVTDIRESDGGGDVPATGSAVVRFGRSAAVDELLRDLVALPSVDGVALGTAEQPPAELHDAGLPGYLDQGRTLGSLAVPVHGRDDPLVYEIWEPAPGTLCYGARPTASCRHLTVRAGQVGGGSNTPHEGRPGCRSVITGPGVDHVRMTASDDTRLEVATAPLHPRLTVLSLHVACWTDAAPMVDVELVAPDGTVIDGTR